MHALLKCNVVKTFVVVVVVLSSQNDQQNGNFVKMNGHNPPSCDHFSPGGGGHSHMKQTGMLVGNFEFNP